MLGWYGRWRPTDYEVRIGASLCDKPPMLFCLAMLLFSSLTH